MPLALLPMYDWPEVRAETDALWAAVRQRLVAAGISAPAALSRDGDIEAAWLSPDLVLGQTCGLPFVTRLKDRVALLGTPVYSLEGCPPGDYYSVLVVRAEEPVESLAALRGATAAYNMVGSQSGHAALLAAVAPYAGKGGFFGVMLGTGSHRGSIRAVAAGKATVAAIDAVSWGLAMRHEVAARRLRVLDRTAPTPGLPFITARARAGQAATICAAVEAAVDRLDRPLRLALLLEGFRRRQPAEHDVLATAA